MPGTRTAVTVLENRSESVVLEHAEHDFRDLLLRRGWGMCEQGWEIGIDPFPLLPQTGFVNGIVADDHVEITIMIQVNEANAIFTAVRRPE